VEKRRPGEQQDRHKPAEQQLHVARKIKTVIPAGGGNDGSYDSGSSQHIIRGLQ
jgi:hypothetical protein